MFKLILVTADLSESNISKNYGKTDWKTDE